MDQEQLLKLLAVLRRHGWILVQSVVTVAVAAAYFASRAPDLPYVATASLVYDVRSTGADPNAAVPGWTALHAISWVRKSGVGDNDPAPQGSGNMTSLGSCFTCRRT